MQQGLKISIMPDESEGFQGKVMEERELDLLFDRWRAWSHSDNFGIGFKSYVIEHQLMIEGAVTRVTGGTVIEDEECERLDAAISKMPPTMKKAVKLKYLFGWTNKDAAKAMRMAIPTYKQLNQRCRSWLCGRLTE